MKRIIIVAGARPNFVKIAALMFELKKYETSFDTILVHTGQHYDYKMSEVFFQNLNIPAPDIFLNIGSGSHAVQTAKIMTAFEKVILKTKPDMITVVGDVNSTLACSLVAAKLHVKIVHVEAGLRSFDRTMPEEINRIVTDSLSDLLLVSERIGLKNLEREGVHSDKVHFVGNIMIDTLLANMKTINASKILENLNLKKKKYCIMTLHRPSNVDSKEALSEIFETMELISQQINIVYPIHPRTKKMLEMHGIFKKCEQMENLFMVDPLGYIDFIKLVKESMFALTDSGGIQEESTVLKVPCLTMRENTERPITVQKGTNYIVGRSKSKIMRHVADILCKRSKKGTIPAKWDGKTAKRIVKILKEAG